MERSVERAARRRRALAAGGAVPRCDAAAVDGVSLSTDEGAYAPGATARVQLWNGTDVRVHYTDLACVGLQARVDGGWDDIEEGWPAAACPGVLYELAAGDAAMAEVALGAVAAGTYRFRTVVYLDGKEAVPLATTSFDVDPALAEAR